MSACMFSVPFSGNAEDVLTKAQSAIQGQGGNFKGDTEGGDFNVSVFGNVISGSYTVRGQEMNVTIDSKPFLIPCSTIENFMKNQIAG